MKNLHELPRQDPFQVPTGYLERLPTAIQLRTQKMATEQRPVKQPSAWLLPSLHFAYVLLVFAAVIFFSVKEAESTGVNATVLLQETSEQEILHYLNNNTSLSLQELLADTELNEQRTLIEEWPEEEILEQEIAQQLDNYSAEELWK